MQPNPPDRMTAKQYLEMESKTARAGFGGAWRGAVAKPTDVSGIRFPSKIQATVYGFLVACRPCCLIIREPIFDLRSLAVDGRPGRWRPDFLSIRPLAAGDGGGFGVEIHEAKGSKSAESRDWRLRATAARNEYPWVPMYVWRLVRGKPVMRTLEEVLR